MASARLIPIAATHSPSGDSRSVGPSRSASSLCSAMEWPMVAPGRSHSELITHRWPVARAHDGEKQFVDLGVALIARDSHRSGVQRHEEPCPGPTCLNLNLTCRASAPFEGEGPIRVVAWLDPVADASAFAASSAMVEWRWLPVVGPSGAYRRFVSALAANKGACDQDLAELAHLLGLGAGVTPNAPASHMLLRLVRFGLAGVTGTRTLTVRRMAPPLRSSQVDRREPTPPAGAHHAAGPAPGRRDHPGRLGRGDHGAPSLGKRGRPAPPPFHLPPLVPVPTPRGGATWSTRRSAQRGRRLD